MNLQLKISHLRALPVPGRDVGELYERIVAASRAVQAGDGKQTNSLYATFRRKKELTSFKDEYFLPLFKSGVPINLFCTNIFS